MSKKFRNWVAALFILNDLTLFPCVFWTLTDIWNRLAGDVPEFMYPGRTLAALSMIVYVFLRCFYLPYIFSAALIGLSVFVLIKDRFPKGETAVFAALTAVCILGLISAETVFDAAMSV